MKNEKYFLSGVAAFTIVGSALLMNGCGGGDSVNNITSESSSLSGVISDGPIFNAKVYIDENGNGKFDIDEPMSYTKKDGSYVIKNLESLQNGSTYYVVSEDDNSTSSILKATDTIDNNGSNLSFLMFKSFTYNGKNVEGSIDPAIFKSELAKHKGNASFFSDVNLTELVNSNKTKTNFFKVYVKDKKADFINLFTQIAGKKGNSNSKLKTDLGLEQTSLVKYVSKDVNTTELSQSYAYKDQTTPAKIGSVVVSLPLQNTTVELNATIDTNTSTGSGTVVAKATNSGNIYNGNSSNPSVVLKKPIFAPTLSQDNKVKVVIGKNGLSDSITISVTPYDNILQIPEYAKLKFKGSVILGADITVKGPNKKKFTLEILKDASISGVILDGHDVNASGLTYYYFNGTSWTNAGKVGTSFNGLNNKLMLAPYVLVDTNSIQESKSVLVSGLEDIKEPVVVAKGKYTDNTASLGKKLFKTVTNNEIITLDADGNISGNTAKFVIPAGYKITEVIVLGEEIPQLTQNDQSIKVPVNGGNADITEKLSLITNPSMKSSLQSGLTALIDFSLFKKAVTTELNYSGDGALAKTLYDTNTNNFLSSDGNNTFVDGNVTTLSWEDNATATTYKLNVDKSKQELLYTETTSFGTATIRLIYSDGKLDKTYSYSGVNNSSYEKITHKINSTVSYIKIDNGYVRADIIRDENKHTSYNESSSSSSSYQSPDNIESNSENGYFIYDENETKVLSSNFKYSVSKTYGGSITGYISTTNNNASFEGDFNIQDVTGHLSVKNATFDFITNTKSLSNAKIVYTTKTQYLWNITQFSKAWLNGKTLYNISGSGSHWSMLKSVWSDTQMVLTPLYNQTIEGEWDYNVTEEGIVKFSNGTYNLQDINITNSTNDYITLNQGSAYKFVDKTKADNFLLGKVIGNANYTGSYTDSCKSTAISLNCSLTNGSGICTTEDSNTLNIYVPSSNKIYFYGVSGTSSQPGYYNVYSYDSTSSLTSVSGKWKGDENNNGTLEHCIGTYSLTVVQQQLP